jgi:hypothetical protein
MDPMFVDTVNYNYHLLAGSPCIDAGDPAYPYDPDSTIADQGCYWFNQIGIVERSLVKYKERAYTGATIFAGSLALPQNINCRVFDITGREIHTLNPSPGVYFLELDGVINTKIIKVR